MLVKILKKSIKKTFHLLGLDVHTLSTSASESPQRQSLPEVLRHLKLVNFSPATVVDVGAAHGTFTSTCCAIFPQARYLMIEALEEYTQFLEPLAKRLSDADYIPLAASSNSGDVVIHVHPDLVGSSMYKEREDSEVNGVERKIPAITLDALSRQRNTAGPYLIKIDTQGAELDILSGAEEVLQETACVLLETSLFDFFEGGPLLYDCILFMKQRGFVVYDIFGPQYRLLDGAMSQIDMAFVRENGPFRTSHIYATPEQRARQDKLFQGAIPVKPEIQNT